MEVPGDTPTSRGGSILITRSKVTVVPAWTAKLLHTLWEWTRNWDAEDGLVLGWPLGGARDQAGSTLGPLGRAGTGWAFPME
jgi:hypothetical protein